MDDMTFLNNVALVFFQRILHHNTKLCINPSAVEVLNEFNTKQPYLFNIMYQNTQIKRLIWIYRFSGLSVEDQNMLDEILKQCDCKTYNNIMGISIQPIIEPDQIQILENTYQATSYVEESLLNA